jgi:hypothetical protein
MQITHPFHPLRGHEFVVVDERHSRHGDRVWYRAADGSAHTMPRAWTSLAEPDLFASTSAGRAWFRFDDLQRLVALIEEVRALRSAGDVRGGGVK